MLKPCVAERQGKRERERREKEGGMGERQGKRQEREKKGGWI